MFSQHMKIWICEVPLLYYVCVSIPQHPGVLSIYRVVLHYIVASTYSYCMYKQEFCEHTMTTYSNILAQKGSKTGSTYSYCHVIDK